MVGGAVTAFVVFFALGSVFAFASGAALLGFILLEISVLFALIRSPTSYNPDEVIKLPEYYVRC